LRALSDKLQGDIHQTDHLQHLPRCWTTFRLFWFPQVRLEWCVSSSCICTQSNTFIGNSTFAAITAIVTANLVLAAYIITSIREGLSTQTVPEETKKDK
jgi:hypothetical protein